MRIFQIIENRQFSPKMTPLQQLVNEYLFFISFGSMAIDQESKNESSKKIITDLVNRLQQDSKTFSIDDPQKLERNKDKILRYINDMIQHIVAILKTHLKPDAWDNRKKQINKIITQYNNVQKV